MVAKSDAAKEHKRAYQQEWSLANKDRIRLKQLRYRQSEQGKAVIYARIRRRYAEQKALLNAIKLESGCVDCGYRENPVALDFDHQADKKFKVALMCGHASDRLLLTEVAKCVVRCANCHRIHTWSK